MILALLADEARAEVIISRFVTIWDYMGITDGGIFTWCERFTKGIQSFEACDSDNQNIWSF
jgi:hypothetical protein